MIGCIIILAVYIAIKSRLDKDRNKDQKVVLRPVIIARPATEIVKKSRDTQLGGMLVNYVPGNKKHFNLWESFEKKMGRQKACQYIPESYAIHNTASSEFAELLDSERIRDAKQFILKGEGSSLIKSYLARQGLEDVLDSIKCNKLSARTFAPTACTQSQLDLQKYTIVQKVIPDPMVLGRRVFKIRLFLLLKYKSGGAFWIFA